jgi:hypothetical protein
MLKTTDRVVISFVLSSLTIIEVLTEEKRLRMRHPCERDVKCSVMSSAQNENDFDVLPFL